MAILFLFLIANIIKAQEERKEQKELMEKEKKAKEEEEEKRKNEENERKKNECETEVQNGEENVVHDYKISFEYFIHNI